MFTKTLTHLSVRQNLDQPKMADLFGVPVNTMRHWLAGTRDPNAVAVRLLEVLTLVETLDPGLFDAIVQTNVVERRPPGRPKKEEAAA